jgi:hypothetical protein
MTTSFNLCRVSIATRLFVGSTLSVLVAAIPFSLLMLFEVFTHHTDTLHESLLLGLISIALGIFLGFIVARIISKSILDSIQCLERNINHVIDREPLEQPCAPEFADLFVKLTLLKEIYERSGEEKDELALLLGDLNENTLRNNQLLKKLATDGQDDRGNKYQHGRFSIT